jgi:hypothetical protein
METLQIDQLLTTTPHPAAASASGPPAFWQRVAGTLRVLHRVNPALSAAGWLNVGLAAAGCGVVVSNWSICSVSIKL